MAHEVESRETAASGGKEVAGRLTAKAAADRNNKWTAAHGIHFIADCGE